MARTAKPKKEISMEEALWKSADKLRGSVEPAEYKHVVLSLFFLKFAGDKFDAQRKMITKQYGEKFVDTVAFYTKDNVSYLPEESRWSYIMENAKQDDVALKIDTALNTIEKSNPALKGALPDNYYSRLQLDTAKLASLLDEINRMDIGPAGLGGRTTALAVHIETYPTHIAGLPVAVNLCCHAYRHAHAVL